MKQGTAYYRAPEVLGSDGEGRYTQRADVYSFAITCFEILSGSRPACFEKATPTELLNQVKAGVRPELPFFCPSGLSRIIGRCWSSDPDLRPPFEAISKMLRYVNIFLTIDSSPYHSVPSEVEEEQYVLVESHVSFLKMVGYQKILLDQRNDPLTEFTHEQLVTATSKGDSSGAAASAGCLTRSAARNEGSPAMDVIVAGPIASRNEAAETSVIDVGVTRDRPENPRKRKLLLKMPASTLDQGNEIPPDDGLTWRKFGEKRIHGALYPRSSYRCAHQTHLGCQVIKHVQRCDDDSSIFDVTYRGLHSCRSQQLDSQESTSNTNISSNNFINTSVGGANLHQFTSSSQADNLLLRSSSSSNSISSSSSSNHLLLRILRFMQSRNKHRR